MAREAPLYGTYVSLTGEECIPRPVPDSEVPLYGTYEPLTGVECIPGPGIGAYSSTEYTVLETAGSTVLETAGSTASLPVIIEPPRGRHTLEEAPPIPNVSTLKLEDLKSMVMIGRGNAGVTFKAELVAPGLAGAPAEWVVIKAFIADKGVDLYETCSQVALPSHPNVLPLLSLVVGDLRKLTAAASDGNGSADPLPVLQPYSLVVPWVENGGLDTYLLESGRPGLDERAACTIAFQMARGVAHLHRYGFVHRDIALRNFLVSAGSWDSEFPKVLLADFGLAKPIDVLARETPEVLAKVPLPWRQNPPEMWFGGKFYLESDVWQFGVAMWELWNWQKAKQGDKGTAASIPRPFAHFATLKELRAFLKDPDNAGFLADDVPADCPEPFRELMRSCFAFQPSERPTMSQVADQLRTMLETQGAAIPLLRNSAILKETEVGDILGFVAATPAETAQPRLRRVYQATQDGDQAAVFYDKLDGLGNLVHVIETTSGAVFGGFAKMKWMKKPNGKKRIAASCEDDAFLFSVRRPHLDPSDVKNKGGVPLKFVLKNGDLRKDFALRCISDKLTAFGSQDIVIAEGCISGISSNGEKIDHAQSMAGDMERGTVSYVTPGNTYDIGDWAHSTGREYREGYFCGSSYGWKVKELEVFQVI